MVLFVVSSVVSMHALWYVVLFGFSMVGVGGMVVVVLVIGVLSCVLVSD